MRAACIVRNCNLLQTAGSSSMPSGQSRSPSQCHILGMHLPLLHLNSVSLHSWVSEMFRWEWATAPSEGTIAHASSNRTRVHREASEGRVELLPPSCMIARGVNLLMLVMCKLHRAKPRDALRSYDFYHALEEKSDVSNQRSVNLYVIIARRMIFERDSHRMMTVRPESIHDLASLMKSHWRMSSDKYANCTCCI